MLCRAVQKRLGGCFDYAQAHASLTESKSELTLQGLMAKSNKGYSHGTDTGELQ